MKNYKVENMTKTYGEKILFNQIAFSIAEKDKVGLIGINGTGKSTLLKCLYGIDTYDTADIIHAKEYSIGYLAQDVKIDESLSVLDAIFESPVKIMRLIKDYEQILLDLQKDNSQINQAKLLTLQEEMEKENAWDASATAKTILSKLGIRDYEKIVGNLSGGEKKRLALAKVLIESPDLLLLDEPTNHLDFETIEWLEKYLKGYPKAILVITHDRYFLDNISTRTFELDKGRLFEYEGNYSSFLEKKAEREANELSQYHKHKSIYKKELEWIRRGAKARTTKQQARIDRFEALEEKLEHKPKVEKIEIDLDTSRLGKQVFEIDNISKSFADQKILDGFSFIVNNKARIGIVGANGIGKSTFLNLLAGKIQLDSGTIKTGQTVKIAYYGQETQGMDTSLRMINYLRSGAEVIKNADGTTLSAAQLLENFLFPMHTHGTIIDKLSGGEKRRLYLLRLLMEQPNVLLLDEPTNDLDTQTLSILEDYLENFSGAVITVSHDRYFLDKVVDELLVFLGQGEINHYIGNYSDYIASGGSLRKEITKEKVLVTENKKEVPRKNKPTYMEKKEWETIDDVISDLEEKLSMIEAEMVLKATDFEAITRLTKVQEAIKKELDEKMARWEYLAEIFE